MCNAWKHLPSCGCGWGGEGHTGRSSCFSLITRDTYKAIPYVDRGKGMYRWSIFYEDFTRPTSCHICKADVFFIRHNGGSVWLDCLGSPWEKHGCFDQKSEGNLNIDNVKLDDVHGCKQINTTYEFYESVQKYLSNESYKLGVLTTVEQIEIGKHRITVNFGAGINKEVVINDNYDPMKLVGALIVSDTSYKDVNVCFKVQTHEFTKYEWSKLAQVQLRVNKEISCKWNLGDYVKHTELGLGKIIGMELVSDDVKLSIEFIKNGLKKLMASYIKLDRADNYELSIADIKKQCINCIQWLLNEYKMNQIKVNVELVESKCLSNKYQTSYMLTNKDDRSYVIVVAAMRYIIDIIYDMLYQLEKIIFSENNKSHNISSISEFEVLKARDIASQNTYRYIRHIDKIWQ